MKRGSECLSQGGEVLAGAAHAGAPEKFDVLIIGSGYGGAVAAARLAQAGGLRVAVLERGLEYRPGDFPANLDAVPGHMRMGRGEGSDVDGLADGLFDFKMGGDVWALVANGLGGGSLINAGVAEEPDAPTLADEDWPTAWRSPVAAWPGLFERARQALGAQVWPAPALPKDRAMAQLGQRLGRVAQPVSLTITPPTGTPPTPGWTPETHEAACVQCGDCFSGCNVGAKRTLTGNYLLRAHRHGAGLYTGVTVRRIERGTPSTGSRWAIECVLTHPQRWPDAGVKERFQVLADHVIVSAGAFGSTEILMRSEQSGLRFSSQLGQRFSTNGDLLAAQYDLPWPASSVADETQAPADRQLGPTITRKIDLRSTDKNGRKTGFVVENLTAPGPLGWFYKELLSTVVVPQRWTRWRIGFSVNTDRCVVDDKKIENTLLLCAIGYDGAQGQLTRLPGFQMARADGGLCITWPNLREAPWLTGPDALLKQATDRTGSAFWLRNPLWHFSPDAPELIRPARTGRALTVHPLGGCRMADDGRQGVVDPWGRVFDLGTAFQPAVPTSAGQVPEGLEGRLVHEGLYVLDGSVVPTSLGINPLLTITALAEGVVDEWFRLGWFVAQGTRHAGPVPAAMQAAPPAWTKPPTGPTALHIHERMSGVLGEREPDLDGSGEASPSAPPGSHQTRLSLVCEFAEVPDLQAFLAQARKSVALKGHFTLATEQRHSAHADQLPESHPLGAPEELHGTVFWFEQEDTHLAQRVLRSVRAWWHERRLADLAEDPQRWWRKPWRTRLLLARAASNFGSTRHLRYEFACLQNDWRVPLPDGTHFHLPKGTRLHGRKDLVYVAGGNPWRQLTEMPLWAQVPGEATPRWLTTLVFDGLHRLDRHMLPVQVVRQATGVHGIRDTLSLGLYFARVVADTHFPSFRQPALPEAKTQKQIRRLPWQPAQAGSAYEGLAFEQFFFLPPPRPRPGNATPPQRLGLTHFTPSPDGKDKNNNTPRRVVLMLHGFGSGGIQFTHPSIPSPMAPWLARQGHDVWVGELRTSIGLTDGDPQWSLDEVALNDVPALIDEVLTRTGATQIDIVAHCIGSAMFCMAALAGRLKHEHGPSKVRSATLLQVSPLVTLPKRNRMRAFMAGRLQKMAGLRKVESTIDAQDKDSGNHQLNRLFTTNPYPKGSRGAARLSGDPQRNRWLTNAHRSAAVFGQLFQFDKMSDAVLHDMGDLLGPCNLTTYQQTAYFAYQGQLTDQAGDNLYVTPENLRQNFGFPVFFVHGGKNEVFHPSGTWQSLQLLARVRQAARQDVPAWRLRLEDYGHLDCVVGNGLGTALLPAIHHFIRDPDQVPAPDASGLPATAEGGEQRLHAPAIGPWLGDVVPDGQGGLTLSIALKARDDRPPATHLVLVIAPDGIAPAGPGLLTVHSLAPAPPANLHVWPEGELIVRMHIARSTLQRVNTQLEVWVRTANDAAAVDGTPAQVIERASQQRERDAEKRNRQRLNPLIDHVVLTRAQLTQYLGEDSAATPFRFFVGCCRQSPLLADRAVADAAFQGMLALHQQQPAQLLLLLGDQVYADVPPPTRGAAASRQRHADAYREAWTAPHQADLMRRMPVVMTPDDHEFRDNFNDSTCDARADEHQHARSSWERYQLAPGPAGGSRTGGFLTPPLTPTTEFAFGSHDFFIFDTRTARKDEISAHRNGATIGSPDDWARLSDWLQKTAPSRSPWRPRLLAMATPAFPGFAHMDGPLAVRADNWQRFPHERNRLLALLQQWGDGLTLIAGDYHCFVEGELTLRQHGAPDARVKVVVTSGLYSPYSVANPVQEQLLQTEAGSIGPITWHYQQKSFQTGSGFTELVATPGAAVAVRFHRA